MQSDRSQGLRSPRWLVHGATGLVLMLALLACNRSGGDAEESSAPGSRETTAAVGDDATASDEPVATAEAPAIDEAPAIADGAPAVPEREAEAVETEPSPEPPAAPVPAAFMNVGGVTGLTLVTEAGLSELEGSVQTAGCEFVTADDGLVYCQGMSGVFLMRSNGVTHVLDAPRGARDMDVAPDGTWWAITEEGVLVHRDGAWAAEAGSAEALGGAPTRSIAIDATGQPWAMTKNYLATKIDGQWQQVDAPFRTDKGSYRRLFRSHGAQRAVYLSGGGNIGRLHPDPARIKTHLDRYAYPDDGVGGSTGLAVVHAGEDVSVIAPKALAGRLRKELAPGVGYVSSVAVDDQNRVWIGGETGVAIVDLEARTRVAWPLGGFDRLTGRTFNLAVEGPGPALPSPGAVAPSALEGVVMRDGAPAAGRRVQFCKLPSGYDKKSPCHGHDEVYEAVTDEAGRYRIEDVALGDWAIAVEREPGDWQFNYSAPLGFEMRAGETATYPTFEIEPAEPSGPPLDEHGEVMRGGITGVIMNGDAPGAGLTVQACPVPSVIFTRRPCENYDELHEAVTDDAGRFTIEGVPLGDYGLSVKMDRKTWQSTLGPPFGVEMRHNEVISYGTIKLEQD